MPFYDYQCIGCGFTQEELRSLNERDDFSICQKCQKKSMTPVISGKLLIKSKENHTPKNLVEKLTGPNVKGPGLAVKNKVPFLSSGKHSH